jgi:hypothetical protein
MRNARRSFLNLSDGESCSVRNLLRTANAESATVPTNSRHYLLKSLLTILVSLSSLGLANSVIATPPQGNFTPLVNSIIPTFGPPETLPEACQPILLTDGTVMVQNCDGDGVTFPHTGDIWKLTPDIDGNYVKGTWSKLAPLPNLNYDQYNNTQFLPLYFAAQVLADGRVIYAGGEYQGPFYDFLGLGANGVAIYDPAKDTWKPINPPAFFTDLYPPRATCPRDLSFTPGHLCAPNIIADGQSVLLADGTFMLGDKMSTQAALLDLKKLTWKETGTASKGRYWNDEESYTLLPSGKVLTVNTYTEAHFCPPGNTDCPYSFPYPADPTRSQIYDPKMGKWTYAGSTINTLTDPVDSEIGPSILRPDGTVYVGGTDGHNSVYDSNTGQWSVAPHLPTVPTLTPYLTISAPTSAANTYNNIYPGGYSVSASNFSVNGHIVPTTPTDACAGPYAPLPANSIALIGLSYADSNNACDALASQQAVAAGAIGIIFYVSDGPNSLISNGAGGSSVVPTITVQYATGQILVNNSTGLIGTMANALAPQQLGFGDTFAALLPNGNIFAYAVASSPFSAGVEQFLEITGSNNSILEPNPEPTPFGLNMVLLPTGQVFVADISTGYTGIYTSGDTTHNPAWEPKISKAPIIVQPGNTYRIDGVLFNGMSQASHGSDDGQSATNYPLVRITMPNHHVFYMRTHDHSFMGVAAVTKPVYTYFDVPKVWAGHKMEYGLGKLEVIANGISSKPSYVLVLPQVGGH